jgi:hypothetical protein
VMDAEERDKGELRRDDRRCRIRRGDEYSDRMRGELEIAVGGDTGVVGTCTWRSG